MSKPNDINVAEARENLASAIKIERDRLKAIDERFAFDMFDYEPLGMWDLEMAAEHILRDAWGLFADRDLDGVFSSAMLCSVIVACEATREAAEKWRDVERYLERHDRALADLAWLKQWAAAKSDTQVKAAIAAMISGAGADSRSWLLETKQSVAAMRDILVAFASNTNLIVKLRAEAGVAERLAREAKTKTGSAKRKAVADAVTDNNITADNIVSLAAFRKAQGGGDAD